MNKMPCTMHDKAMVFPVVMYGCESWTIKKAECQRIDAFELWRWKRLLRVPWTARRSNQSILKEISPGCSLEELMLKLKFQYFSHLMWRADSLEKTLMLGKIEGGRRRGQQRMRWLDGITNKSLGKLRELVIRQWGLACCSSWDRKESDTTEQLNWTDAWHTDRQAAVQSKSVLANDKRSFQLIFTNTHSNKIIKNSHEKLSFSNTAEYVQFYFYKWLSNTYSRSRESTNFWSTNCLQEFRSTAKGAESPPGQKHARE